MKRLKTILFALIALLFSTANADKITIAADNWCPFNCDPNSDRLGYMIEIAKQVFEKKGHTIEYKTVPWTRAIEQARAGTFNAIVGAFQSDAPDFVFPENELGKGGNAFFTLKDKTWTYTGIPSLGQISLGVISDYAYTDDLDAYIKKNKNDPKRVQAVAGDKALDNNIQKLLGGRVDAVIEEISVFWYNADKLGAKDKMKLVGKAAEQKSYIAFSPANPKSKEYAKILSDGVESLRKSGELAKIMAKYGLRDWK